MANAELCSIRTASSDCARGGHVLRNARRLTIRLTLRIVCGLAPVSALLVAVVDRVSLTRSAALIANRDSELALALVQ